MAFANQFLSHFTAEEQKTDFVKIWCAIGTNLEKSLYEFLSGETTINSDINFFTEEMYSSWLGFFLQKIRNRTCSKAVVTVTILPNDRNVRVEIPEGTTLTSSKGTYVQRQLIRLLPGNSATFLAYQGKEVTQIAKNYQDFIKIDANNIDLDTLVITDDEGNEVPEVSYETSWCGLKYMGSAYIKTNKGVASAFIENSEKTLTDAVGEKGQFYVVVVPQVLTSGGDLEGNKITDENLGLLNGSIIYRGNWLIYDGTHWTCSAPSYSFMPFQIGAGVGIPQNGYYAYVSGGNLYVKIFSGSEVTDPTGRTYTLSFISTDGVQGKVSADTLDYTSVLKDIDGETVEYEITNQESSSALNGITRGQLNMLTRQTLYASGTLASIPEYTAWFNAQPEVGSCFVYSDFEKWMATGINPNTGYVTVVAVRPDGSNLTDEDTTTLSERLEGKKDVAFIQFLTPERVECYFDVKYRSSTDDQQFQELLITTIESYFNPDSLRERNLSLFEGLDLSLITKAIGTEYSNEGLRITAYHHLFAEFGSGATAFQVHNGEKVGGGWYIARYPNSEGKYVDEDGNFVGTQEKWFERTIGDNEDVAYIYKVDDEGNEVSLGQRTSSAILLTVNNGICRVEAFIPMKEEGMLTIDAFENRTTQSGETESVPIMRSLISEDDVESGKYSTGSIVITAYGD